MYFNDVLDQEMKNLFNKIAGTEPFTIFHLLRIVPIIRSA